MRVLNLESIREGWEMPNYIEGDDIEGCGGHLPEENQLDSFCKKYLESRGGIMTRELDISGRVSDIHHSTSFWNLGEAKIRMRYSQHNEDFDWPFSYPQNEKVELKVWGRIDPSLEADLRTHFQETALA